MSYYNNKNKSECDSDIVNVGELKVSYYSLDYGGGWYILYDHGAF